MFKVLVPEAKRFITDCLKSVGTRRKLAEQQAELFVYADRMGHSRYGLIRLDSYVYNIKTGLCTPNNVPVVLKEGTSRAWIDVQGVMGATAGRFAMDLAIKKANETGVGWVSVRRSNYDAKPYNYWVNQAAEMGLIGSVFTSKRKKQLKLAPGKQTNRNTPNNQLICVKDVELALNNACIEKNPLIKASTLSRRKGCSVCLAAMMKTLSTALGSCTTNRRECMMKPDVEQNFVAVNPTCFALGFDREVGLAECIQYCKEFDTGPKLPEFLLENLEYEADPELTDTPLFYKEKQIQNSLDLARVLEVEPMKLAF